MSLKKLPEMIARKEGKKSQARIGDIREIFKVLKGLLAVDYISGGTMFDDLVIEIINQGNKMKKQAMKAKKTAVLMAIAFFVQGCEAVPTPVPTITATPTETVSPVPTETVTPEPTATVTVSPTPTVTVTPEPTATATVTPTPTATATATPTVTPTPTPTVTVIPTPPSSGVNLVSRALMPSVGPLFARNSLALQPFKTLDSNLVANELKTYNAFVANPTTIAVAENHYGALRSRIQYSIRAGLPFGAGNQDNSTAYGRGREILMRYFTAYAIPNNFALPPHNSTALNDAEALYVLEGYDPAKSFIWATAMYSNGKKDGYYDASAGGDARIVAIGLQATNAAHRLQIPFKAYKPGTYWNVYSQATSWKEAGEHRIKAMLASPSLKADGTLHSPAHQGQCGTSAVCEAYFMSAMLATEFLRWHGFVSPNQAALDGARKLMDHMISESQRLKATIPSLLCLPYLSSGTSEATDLSAFQVWPALVLWQETGDAKYKTHAMNCLQSSQKAFVSSVKQFNQTYSTNAQTAEALLAGVSWK